MDPDETLRRLRTLCGRVEAMETTEDVAGLALAAAECVELFVALDSWISRGGFLPRAWGIWRTS
jgi:hypothetical protein